MKKYTTKPIDFTGCHPVIAEALKRGEAIECWVWSDSVFSKKSTGFVVGYERGVCYPYRIAPNMNSGYAVPIPLKVHRIMPPQQAIPVLIANGWEYNEEGVLVGEPPIVSSMFKEMGGLLDKSRAVWPSCIVYESEGDDE